MNGINILLVASNLQNCQEMRQFFANHQHNLIIAKDEDTAIDLLQKKSVEAVICPTESHLINGFDLLQKLQNRRETAKIPFILLGKHFDRQQHRQAMEMGADDILFLPYYLLDIEAAVATRVKKNQALLNRSQEELEQLRYSITNSLPHEMRTSLTGIIAASELLDRHRETLEPEIVKEMLTCINSSGKRLLHLIHNFLLYSELKSIARDTNRITHLRKNKTIRVKRAIADMAIEQSQKYSRQADIILDLEEASVQISSFSLNKLVTELIDNACKFSSCGTPIVISSKIENNFFKLNIRDRGRGMSPEQITNIGWGMQFDRLIYEQQGFGLGLVISQNLVELHGGNLFIDSTSEGTTTVSVTLPLAMRSERNLLTNC